jgi:hypothetical protein
MKKDFNLKIFFNELSNKLSIKNPFFNIGTAISKSYNVDRYSKDYYAIENKLDLYFNNIHGSIKKSFSKLHSSIKYMPVLKIGDYTEGTDHLLVIEYAYIFSKNIDYQSFLFYSHNMPGHEINYVLKVFKNNTTDFKREIPKIITKHIQNNNHQFLIKEVSFNKNYTWNIGNLKKIINKFNKKMNKVTFNSDLSKVVIKRMEI